jgi:hypothetical protein
MERAMGIEPNAYMVLESMDSSPITTVHNLYFPDQLQNVGVSPEESTACER